MSMNAKDTAINLCKWMEVGAEPAGSSGCFWSVRGPRRIYRESAEDDIAKMRFGIEQAIKGAREKLPIPMKKDLESRFIPILNLVLAGESPFSEDWTPQEAVGPVVDEVIRLLQELNS